MNNLTNIPNTSSSEGIDFNKLKIVIRNNWPWLLLIFLVINIAAFLYIRYTKNFYESESELKLDIKDDATELGIKNVVEDQNVNLLSGEIEIIQSKLFLNRVLDSTKLDVSYFSVGRVLNEELFKHTPFIVKYNLTDNNWYNVPIYFEEKNANEFGLKVGNEGRETRGFYNQKVALPGIELVLKKNVAFSKGDEIGYFFIINSRDVLLSYFQKNLTAEPLNFNANTIRISFKDHNAFKAHAILNRLDTIYLQYSNEQKNLANKQKIDWLSNELAVIENKMEAYENYFENFTLENKTNNLDEDLTKTIASINQLDSQRFDLSQKINRIDNLTEGLKRGDYALSFSHRLIFPASLVKNLDALQELLLEQEKLKMSYSELTFAYRSSQKEIETLQQKSLSQLAEIKSDWAKRLQELTRRKNILENEFANIPDKNTQFSKNLRFYKLNEQFYLTLMQSRSEFEIAQAGSTPDFKILSPASFPVSPIAPKKTLIAGAGFVISWVFMIFFIGISYLANNKITSVQELEKIPNVPILGIIPSSRYTADGALHVIHHPKSMISEALRTLRSNLDFFNVQNTRKVIAISSTVSGEGKSFIAVNLGGIMAASKKRVVLLDLDMRKAKLNLPVSVTDHSKGISTILIKRNNWQECILKTEIDTFDYLPSGPHPPNPAELLLNGEFSELLENLKTNYDYVILDTPPAGLVTDGIMAMKQADISIYVFRANYSKKDFLNNLQRTININKFSNLTIVLNALPASSEKSYGYGYYEDSNHNGFWKKYLKRRV